jgi:hypothetical protein
VQSAAKRLDATTLFHSEFILSSHADDCPRSLALLNGNRMGETKLCLRLSADISRSSVNVQEICARREDAGCNEFKELKFVIEDWRPLRILVGLRIYYTAVGAADLLRG